MSGNTAKQKNGDQDTSNYQNQESSWVLYPNYLLHKKDIKFRQQKK